MWQLKGCSAGGLATILHLDYVAEWLRTAAPRATVVGVPDAGYFLDHNDTTGAPTWTPLYQWVVSAQNTTPSVDAGCVAHYGGTGEEWKCFMAQYTAPFITTPAFFAQDLDDSWQMQVPCVAQPRAVCVCLSGCSLWCGGARVCLCACACPCVDCVVLWPVSACVRVLVRV